MCPQQGPALAGCASISWPIRSALAAIFRRVRVEVEALVPDSRPLCVALDDTILRKTGRTIPGAAYRKGPLGQPFNLNLVWAQRMQQISAAVADENSEVRMVPISLRDASTPRKPSKGASPAHHDLYREAMKQRNLNALAVESLGRLQEERAGENPPGPGNPVGQGDTLRSFRRLHATRRGKHEVG